MPVGRRGAGVRVRFRGLPATKWGRIFAGFVLLVCMGLGVAGLSMARSYLLHDERFMIPSSASIEVEGNAHVTRAQALLGRSHETFAATIRGSTGAQLVPSVRAIDFQFTHDRLRRY